MSKFNEPLPGHCEGCDSQRLDIRRYFVVYHNVDPKRHKPGATYEVFYCGDCRAMAELDWSGTICRIWEPREVSEYERSLDDPDPDIRLGGKHHGDPWCDPSAR